MVAGQDAVGMFRVRLLLGYLLVGVLTASAASADTGGQPWDRSPPWSAIGRVQRGAAGPCSGILIAPDKALTVAHCAGDPGSPQGLTFVTKTQAYKVTKILTASGAATAGGNAQLDQLRRDWAILTLTRSGSGTPPPPATFAGLPAARAVYLASDQLAKAGYQEANGRVDVLRDLDCRIIDLDPTGQVFVFHCRGGMGPGVSGSPLFAPTQTGWTVVGSQSAKFEKDQETYGITVMPPEEIVRDAIKPPK